MHMAKLTSKKKCPISSQSYMSEILSRTTAHSELTDCPAGMKLLSLFNIPYKTTTTKNNKHATFYSMESMQKQYVCCILFKEI